MGIHDRDYYRDGPPRAGFGYFSAWSVTTWLIVINIAVYLLDGLLRGAKQSAIDPYDLAFDSEVAFVRFVMFYRMGPLEWWGHFSTELAVHHGQVWRFVTFQFLHASPMHLLGNMLGMFFFGPIVEAHFGGRRYLAFYLLCGLAGAALYLLLGAAGVLSHGAATPLVGASAGVFGLLVAAAMIAPDVEVFLYFFPVRIAVLAVVMMLVAAVTVVNSGANAGGEAAHLGGGALGFLFMRNQHWLNPFAPARRTALATRQRRRPRAFQKDWSKDMNR